MNAVASSPLRNLLQLALRPLPASVLMAVFNFAVCYLRSFVFPKIPIVLWGDQISFFNAGSRMVLGQLPYRDYFQIVPPATDLTYALLIKCFGVQMWIPNLVMAFLAAVTALLMTLIASRLMRGAVILLPGLLLAGLILPASADATHHWFSTIAILAATLVLIDGTTLPRITAAGALCGVAACFTQTKGALAVAAFAVCLVYEARPRTTKNGWLWQACLALCGAAAAVFVTFNAYFVHAAGLRQWLFCVLVYPLRYYSAPTVNNWHVLLHDFGWHAGIARWVSFPFVYATVPLVYIVFVVFAWRRRNADKKTPWHRLLLVGAAGVAMFLAVAHSPSVKRLGTVAPPALILLAWLLSREAQPEETQQARRVACLKIVLGTGAFAIAVISAAHIQGKHYTFVDLPAGRAAFTDAALYDEHRWLLTHTHPGQYFFGLPPLYSAFHMRNPAAIEGFHPSEYTRPEQVTALVEALESHPVPLLMLRQSRDLLRATSSPHDHLGPFREYVLRHYQLTKSFSTGDDVWERIDTPPPAP